MNWWINIKKERIDEGDWGRTSENKQIKLEKFRKERKKISEWKRMKEWMKELNEWKKEIMNNGWVGKAKKTELMNESKTDYMNEFMDLKKLM